MSHFGILFATHSVLEHDMHTVRKPPLRSFEMTKFFWKACSPPCAYVTGGKHGCSKESVDRVVSFRRHRVNHELQKPRLGQTREVLSPDHQ